MRFGVDIGHGLALCFAKFDPDLPSLFPKLVNLSHPAGMLTAEDHDLIADSKWRSVDSGDAVQEGPEHKHAGEYRKEQPKHATNANQESRPEHADR